jgi:hypothetical protein
MRLILGRRLDPTCPHMLSGVDQLGSLMLGWGALQGVGAFRSRKCLSCNPQFSVAFQLFFPL